MKINNLNIIPPEGMEAYQEGNEIRFRPINKSLTYDDIADELFLHKDSVYIGNFARIGSWNADSKDDAHYPNICVNTKQAKKLLAINKLMNVAKYLNGDWKPNWDNVKEAKYYIYHYNEKYTNIGINSVYNYNLVYFKTKNLAQQAIDILGKETIKLALSTDW